MKTLRLLLLLSLTCIIASHVAAQTANVSGTVLRDGVSGIPYAWVTYTHDGSGTTYDTQCDNTGRYEFTNLVLPVSERGNFQSSVTLPSIATNHGGSSHNFFLTSSQPITRLSICDVLGREAVTLPLQNNRLTPSLWVVEGYWDGRSTTGIPVSSGVYFAAFGLVKPAIKFFHRSNGNATTRLSYQSTPSFRQQLAASLTTSVVKYGSRVQLESQYTIRIAPDSLSRSIYPRTILRTLHDATINIVIDSVFAPFPNRILFVGNSYTYYNNGVDVDLNLFVQSADTSLHPTIESVTGGGYTFQMHYNNATTRQRIETGGYDLIVFQEQSTRPLEQPELMFQYGRALQLSAANGGAETGLFMTWARQYNPSMIDSLQWAYDSLGYSVNALMCPVGLAFEEVRVTMPTMNLYDTDGSHPSVYGTYLAVCVFYASIWNRSPIGVAYVNHPQITAEERLFLQTTAWNIVRNYRHPGNP